MCALLNRECSPRAAFAAQSLLAALGSLQLVANVFFAYLVNQEPVSWSQAGLLSAYTHVLERQERVYPSQPWQVTLVIILSTLCIIGGCILLVVFGNRSSETYTVANLIDLFKK